MKRLIVMAIMAAFILGTVSMAQAVHQPAAFKLEAKGDWQMSGNYVKNPTFDKDAKVDKFQATQRLRTAFEFVANENLKAVLRLHIENRWGQDGHQVGVSGRDTLGYDLAYLDFVIPNTQVNIKAGKQLITLPGNLGSHIMDDFAYGVVGSVPFNEMVGLTLGWARLSDELQGTEREDEDDPSSDLSKANPTKYSQDEIDMFVAILPVTMDGFQINPFAAYARTGKYVGLESGDADGSEKSQNTYWLGINAAVDMFDPIVVLADFNYGSAGKTNSNDREGQTAGWIASLAVDYKMDMFTPRLYALYESGESSSSFGNDKKGKIMPTVSGDLYGISSFGFNGSSFRGLGRARINAAQENAAWGPSGKWGVGLKLMDISFMDKLSHEFQIAYYRGTNDKDSGLFTTKDKAWETNFNTSYQMFENMAAILELGYMDVDLDDVSTDAAWKAAAGVRYRF